MSTLTAARVMATAFHGPCTGKIHYRDEDRRNLRPENLYWENDWATADCPEGAEPVEGFPGYYVTEEGALYSTRSRLQDGLYRRMFPTPDGTGYLRVTATNENGKPKSLKVHRAVALTFLGPPPSRRHQVRHLDGDQQNNRKGNLAWGLPIENSDDKYRHGTVPFGEKGGLAKLTDETAEKVRALFATGLFSQTEIGNFLGVSSATIQKICAGQTYKTKREDA